MPAGPCLPHASIYPSPETPGASPVPSGYAYECDVVGFSQLHTQGTGGVPSYGNFLVSPQAGLDLPELDHASPTADEQARSYAYHVRLTRYGITCGVVPTRHCALCHFTFPASKQSNVLIDVACKIGSDVRDDREDRWTQSIHPALALRVRT